MARNYLNNFRTTLSAAITDTDTTWTLGTAPPALSVGDFYRFQLAEYATVNGVTTLVKSEFVDLADDGTLTRGVEGSTAQSWDAGDYVQLAATAESFAAAGGGTLDGVTFIEYSETTAAGTADLNPGGGTIQTYTMTANTTFTDSLTDGQNLTYHLSGGDTYTPTWPTITWVGGTPTLSANTVIQFWKIGTTLFGAKVGDY